MCLETSRYFIDQEGPLYLTIINAALRDIKQLQFQAGHWWQGVIQPWTRLWLLLSLEETS